MTKRNYSSGSIRQNSAKSFLVRYYNNGGKQVSETVKGTRKDAERVLRQRRVALETGDFIGRKKLTVEGYLQGWLDSYARSNVTAKTEAGYRQMINRYTGRIGDLQLQRLEATHIQSIYAEMIDQKLSSTTVVQLHRILHKALNTAVKQEILKRNVADATVPPRIEKKPIEVWDEETRIKFLELAKDMQYGDFYHIAILTGMRRGELAGLKWSEVDLVNGRIQVIQTLGRVTGKKLVVGQPKTNRSKRSVALSPDAINLLHEIRGKQITQQTEAAEGWAVTGYVFTHPDGTCIDPNLVTRAFTKAVKKAGLSHLTIHGLRHTHATMLLEAGINPKVVSERLGHASIATTMDIYSHVLPDIQDQAALAIDMKLSQR